MKVCSKCKVEKPLAEFHKNKNRKDGHKFECKSCRTKYYAENKEERVKYGAKYRAENKEEIAKRKTKYYARRSAEQPNCIYQIKNLENNKVYIGETIRGELRWKRHLADLRGNHHANKLLREDFDKYGEGAFEWSILKEFEDEDKDNLVLEEAKTIQRFIIEGKELYNLALTIEQLKMLLEDK